MDFLDGLKRAERLVVVLVDSGSDTGTLGRAGRSVGVDQVDHGTRDRSQRPAEHRTQEHIRMARMDTVDLHADLLHDLHAVVEGEDYSLLRRTDYVVAVVDVEVDAVERAADLAVLQHALGAVAERQYNHSLGSHRDLFGQNVHVGVTDPLRRHILLDP